MRKLYWEKEIDTYLLKNSDEILVALSFKLAGNSSFLINSKEYFISKRGFWNPGYFIEHKEECILKLTHSFWGSNGKIVFNDGTEYGTDYKTLGGLKLRFLDGKKELLVYKTEVVNNRPELHFHVIENIMDAEKLLILAALGMTIFSTIFRESSTSDDDITTLLLFTA